LVRHRPVSYSQESSRFCDYNKKGMTFIIPPWFYDKIKPGFYRDDEKVFDGYSNSNRWLIYIQNSLYAYKNLISAKQTPQQARGVLPNDLKTEIIVTANIKEWNWIIFRRCAKDAHPQIQEIINLVKSFLETKYNKYRKDN